MTTILTGTALLSMALLLIAAYRDVTTLRIPNGLCEAIAVLGVIRLLAFHDMDAALYTISAGITVFLVGLVLFSRGVVGGGDVKLLTATVLLIGYHNLFPQLIMMGVSGALIALIVLVRHKLAPKPTRPLVPYGVAIAAATITVLFHQSF